MKTLRIAIAAVFAVSGWILSDAVRAQSGAELLKRDALVAGIKEGKGHPKVNATDAELKAAVDQVLATK